MSSDLVHRENSLAIPDSPEVASANLLNVIANAVANPQMDVEKMSKLLDMHDRILEEQRQVAFKAALARVQAQMPQINKDGKIIVKGQLRSTFARIEDIDAAIRPLLDTEGFAVSFDTETTHEGKIRIACKLSHKDGYSETKFLALPIDTNEYRSNVQSIGSTISYGKRQLIKMHFNIIERGEDDDGGGGSKTITPEQAKDLQALIDEVKADPGRFMSFMGVDSLESILARDYAKAKNALESKRRSAK